MLCFGMLCVCQVKSTKDRALSQTVVVLYVLASRRHARDDNRDHMD